MASDNPLVLEESILGGDNAQLALYNWLTNASNAAASISVEELKASQNAFEATIVKLVTGAPLYPQPGRPLRNLAARSLNTIYARGETRARFDSIRTFINTMSDLKTSDIVKVACLDCIGQVMAVSGSQVMSLVTDIANTCVRLLKTSSLAVFVRYHAAVCLRRTLSTAARALTDASAKDTMIELHSQPESIKSATEADSIITLCVKNLETADQPTRRSLARLVAHVLNLTQVERQIVVQEKRPAKKDSDQDADADGAPGIPGEATKPLLTPAEMLSHISSHFNKPTSTRKTKVGVFDFYVALFTALGPAFVEANYALIFEHLMKEIVLQVRYPAGPYDTLLVRKLVNTVLRDQIGLRMLSEQGQIGAIREISSSYLKKWPALMPGQAPPSPNVLVIALKEVSGLLQQLGNAPPPVQDALAEPLVSLLSHPHQATQVAAAWCLRCFCYSIPLRLPKTVINVIDLLQRDITSLVTPPVNSEVGRRAIGHAQGLAALFSIITERPLYVSYDLSAKVFDIAIMLLKRAAEHDIAIGGIEVEVAWTLISSLMAFGPNFVRSQLPQLLVLWRNALPKPTSKDTSQGTGRSAGEWSFLLQVREAALGAILSFLRHNSPTLVTLDVARRLASLLSNALNFANAFAGQQGEELRETNLINREAMLRRRVFQCFTALGFSSTTELVQTSLLQSVISLFAGPEAFTGSSVQAAIASSTGNFLSIWSMADGYAYGITSADAVSMSLLESETDGGGAVDCDVKDKLNRDSIETTIDNLLSTPILGSCEHDTLALCRPQSASSDSSWPEPPPAMTGVVDAAIVLFSVLLPQQDLASATKSITQIAQSLKSSKLERNHGRKSAITTNAIAALLYSLRKGTQSRQSREVFGSSQVATTIADLLKEAILDGDPFLRKAGSEALGRLANIAGSAFLSSQTKYLVDQVVSNRDPQGRAGCALAFGSIYSQVGGLAAGPLLKTTINVLMSLGNDPHPVVHYWALTALSEVINAASLSYGQFVSSTLGMLFNLYSAKTHEAEGGTSGNVNITGDLPVYQVMCQIVDALIGVLGPELMEPSRTTSLVFNLSMDFWKEDDEGIQVEAIKCIQHFLMFSGDNANIPQLVDGFRAHLSSTRRPLKVASINALYQLVQKDALLMSKIGGDRLVEDLFAMLDDDSGIDGVRNIIISWLQQTVVLNPSAWIDLCQRIMSRTTASQRATDTATKAGGLQDDEAESLGAGLAATQATGGGTSRWRTQLFALQCLHQICTNVARSGRREHVDLPYALKQGLQPKTLLVSRVPDLIKMAFTASAAYVTEIRLEGLVVLRDVIEVFSKSPDPDYEEALLLEQHQAPITAALTPAFSSDSTPEILASAVQVCAAFVGCGVVKDVTRMGRILKLLTSALEQSKESGMLSIGDVGELSPNASGMLRISTLTAWAELQVSSARQSYLKDVIEPYRATLASLWVSSLRDYASVRGDSELLQDSSSAAMDASYVSMGREVLLPYYERSWIKVLQAVAILMAASDRFVLAAMNGQEADEKSPDVRKPTDEPAMYFYIVFGLVFEALTTNSADASASPTALETVKIALSAFTSLVRPEYAGKVILEPSTFDEVSSLAYRLAMTAAPVIQVHLVSAMASLANSQKTTLQSRITASGSAEPFPSDSPLTHCLRICSYVLRQVIPANARQARVVGSVDERVVLILSSFNAFSIIGDAFGPERKEEVRAVAVSLYADLLKDEYTEVDVCGPTLPALKALLDVQAGGLNAATVPKYGKLAHGLLSACLQHIDEMRGREGVAATLKIKNNLLASVLILTVIPQSVPLSQAAVEHCCYLIGHKLEDSNEQISITAAHCAKTVMLSATSGNQKLLHCVKLLMPGMIHYIAHTAAVVASAEVPENTATVQGVEEVLKAFVTFFESAPQEHRARLLGVLLPLAVLLLDPARSPPTPLHTRTVAHLLTFATSSATAFKDATAKLDGAAKERLETSVRQAVASRSNAPPPTAKPQISLRSF